MKHLLLTTALVSLIAAVPLSAQTTETTGSGAETTATGGAFTPPEGYTAFEAATLTIEDLQGATVYDANGESVGEISDFVFAGGGATGSATGSTTGASGGTSATTDGTGVTTDTTTTTTTDTATTGTETGTAGDTTAGTEGSTDTTTDTGTASDTASQTGSETSGSVTGDATTSAESGTEGVASSTDTDTAATGNATDTTAGTGVTTDTAMEDPALGTGTDTTGAAGTEMAATEPQQELDVASGSISHVVLDVGGFLGIGTHTVAVPLEELQVFRDEGNNIRVYLPWTQAQLEAVPEFDENNPESLDATEGAPAAGEGGAAASGG